MAAALRFPLAVVVLAVRHHFEDEYLVARVKHASDKPILVSTNIEDDAITNMTCRGKVYFHIGPAIPIDRSITHMLVPSPQRSLGVVAAGGLPKLD